MKEILAIDGLRVDAVGKPVREAVLSDLSLKIRPGEVHVLMGLNGSGKTTLAMVLAGKADYKVVSGKINFAGKNLLTMDSTKRARAGLFVSWQQPIEVPGVTWAKYLHAAMGARKKIDALAAWTEMEATMKKLKLPKEMLTRGVNEGFSGGERKRMEAAQLILLAPKLGVLDEIDSGLDSAAREVVVKVINGMRDRDRSWLIITHYPHVAKMFRPDRVSFIERGRIIKSGGQELLRGMK